MGRRKKSTWKQSLTYLGVALLFLFILDLFMITPEDLAGFIGWIDELILLGAGITALMSGTS